MAAVRTTQSTVTAPDSSFAKALNVFNMVMVVPFQGDAFGFITAPTPCLAATSVSHPVPFGMTLYARLIMFPVGSDLGIFVYSKKSA